MVSLITKNSQGKVLVVDDNPQNLRILYTLLSNEGYHVLPVRNPELALMNAQGASPPDLILLDIMMPEISGFQLCKILKNDERSSNIPIIFISAVNNINDILKGFYLGAVDYIRKPFQEEEVLARVNTQISLCKQKKSIEKKNEELEAEISKRKQIESKLRKAKKEADKANNAKSIFLANMSHELRTPLNSIIGFANLLQEDSLLNEKHRKFSNTIVHSGQHLLSLINEILELSKIEAGKLELTPIDFCLLDLMNDLFTLMKIQADNKNIELILDMDDNLPKFVNGDSKRLYQVIQNLVSNAIKFTNKGSVKIRVFTFQSYEQDNVNKNFTTIVSQPIKTNTNKVILCFEIKDTGIGIALKDIKNIFQPFEQTGDQQYREQGTGLGLSICKELIKKMNGGLHLFSKKGEGSTFRIDFLIPVVKGLNHCKSLQNRKIIGIQNQSPTILIAENNENSRKLLQEIMQPAGFKLFFAYNGKEALNKTRKHSPDLLITDFHLPDINGNQLIQKIHKLDKYKNLPVIVLSASVYNEIIQESIAAGCKFFHTKPINAELLYLQLQNLLNIEWQYTDETHLNTLNNQITNIKENKKKKQDTGQKKTVLIVDDTSANYRFLKIILESQHLKVIVAESGKKAIYHAKKNDPDIILMDMLMPDMDGNETIKKIRLIPNMMQIPIIATSSIIRKENFHKYSKSGFNDFLVKPISINDLKDCMHKYLNVKWKNN